MQQALERQIFFQDNHEAFALLGEGDEFLQVFRSEFDCQFVSRGDRMEILGEGAQVEAAAKVMEDLGISPSRRIKGLGARQREQLLEVLSK